MFNKILAEKIAKFENLLNNNSSNKFKYLGIK